jgi:hypothetical protein
MTKTTIYFLLLALWVSFQSIACGKDVSLFFALHDDYATKGETVVIVRNSKMKKVFEHKGEWENWGSKKVGTIAKKGHFSIEVIYYRDSLNKQTFTESFELIGDEIKISLNIALFDGVREPHNSVAVKKYHDNDLEMELVRDWDPSDQHEKDSAMLPKYTLINKSDSTIFGIHHRQSASLKVSWVKLHSIAFTYHQKLIDGQWRNINCKSPRIQAELKPGEKGNTLNDIVFNCDQKHFTESGKYRVVVEYGINNASLRETKSTNTTPRIVYLEPHIYQVVDEYKL